MNVIWKKMLDFMNSWESKMHFFSNGFLRAIMGAKNHKLEQAWGYKPQLGMLLCKIVSSSIYVIITMCGLELVGKPLSTKQWMHEDGRLLGWNLHSRFKGSWRVLSTNRWQLWSWNDWECPGERVPWLFPTCSRWVDDLQALTMVKTPNGTRKISYKWTCK